MRAVIRHWCCKDWAKNVRAAYNCHWECLAIANPPKFEFRTPEGDEGALSRQHNLFRYTEQDFSLIERSNKIRLSESDSKRWLGRTEEVEFNIELVLR